MLNLTIHEILEKAGNASSRAEKIAILKQYNCLGLRDVLKAAFDDSIVFILPKGTPKYTSQLSEEGMPPSDLKRRTVEFSYFIKGGPGEKLSPQKRESLFMGVVEGVDPKDAEMLFAMKDKKFSGRYKGITKALVQEVWPNLIKDEPKKQVS
jgi:Family of unknown function (DUF6433)